HLGDAAAAYAPGDLAAELALGLARDLDPPGAGVLAEPLDAPLGRHVGVVGLGRGQGADDRDLLAIHGDHGGLGEPVIGQPPDEPCRYLCTHVIMITPQREPVNAPAGLRSTSLNGAGVMGRKPDAIMAARVSEEPPPAPPVRPATPGRPPPRRPGRGRP